MSVDTHARSPQAVKVAQQHSVLRFMALYELLGRDLLAVQSVLAIAPGQDTSLSLLRGLSMQVGYEQAEGDTAALLERVYALDEANAPAGSAADLVLLEGDGPLPSNTLDTMREGAWLVVAFPLGGGALGMAEGLRQARELLASLASRGDVERVVFRTIYRHRWIALRKVQQGKADTSAARALRKCQAAFAIAKLAANVPIARRAFSLASITAAHPRGAAQARYKLWAIRRKRRLSIQVQRLIGRSDALTHFGVHAPANAGDRVLFEAVRAAIDPPQQMKWALRDVRADVTAETIAQVNGTRGMVIGGGGLFLVDLDSASPSGWQWPCRTSLLKQIEVPIVVFGVGYNRFRGQSEFPTAFAESLAQLVDSAAFVGIRNHGSIRALREYLPAELAAKLVFQPCPTTVMSFLDLPGSRPSAALPARDHRRLVINTAFDRYALRMARREEATLGAIAQMARKAVAQGWRITVACHLFDDEAIAPYLDKAGVNYDVRHFTGVDTAAILNFYRSVDLVAGMRGHAQMIPFGVGTPIISLIAHDKMGWFLDDIGHPEWGVDFTDPNFAERLGDAFASADRHLESRRAEVAAARASLWAITRGNVATVRRALSLDQSS